MSAKTLTAETIDGVLAVLDRATPTQAMNEHALWLAGYHAAVRDARSTLEAAASMADDDGTIPDYIPYADLLVRAPR